MESHKIENIGVLIKKLRTERRLTQEELGRMVGVKKSQISKVENGQNCRISTIGRIFKALGIATATLDLGNLGKVALW